MDTSIRRAEPTDAAALAQLEDEARQALVDVRGGRRLLLEQPAVGDWATQVGDARTIVWIGLIDDVAVGYLELELPGGDGIGRVRQVYVLPGAREIGFGDELLALAIEASLAAGGTEIESFALPGDRDTKNLYERAGVTARKLIVSKKLT